MNASTRFESPASRSAPSSLLLRPQRSSRRCPLCLLTLSRTPLILQALNAFINLYEGKYTGRDSVLSRYIDAMAAEGHDSCEAAEGKLAWVKNTTVSDTPEEVVEETIMGIIAGASAGAVLVAFAGFISFHAWKAKREAALDGESPSPFRRHYLLRLLLSAPTTAYYSRVPFHLLPRCLMRLSIPPPYLLVRPSRSRRRSFAAVKTPTQLHIPFCMLARKRSG